MARGADLSGMNHLCRYRSAVVGVLMLAGYLFLTLAVIVLFFPSLNPPGFTGNQAYTMGIIFLGAFHTAGSIKQGWIFLLFGGFGATLVTLGYPDNMWGFSAMQVKFALAGWTVFGVSIALLARMFAKIRWRMVRDVPREAPICMHCGYDLRAADSICPECGNPFDPADFRTFNSTIRQWEFRWLIKPTIIVALSIVIPGLIAYAVLYWRLQESAIAEVERSGGQVDTETILPYELRGLPQPIRLIPYENLFRHATAILWRGKPVVDPQLSCVARLSTVTEIHLDNMPITGAGFASLTGKNNVTALYLPGSSIDDAGLAGIACLPKLTQLQLTGTKVTDAGLDHIRSLANLTALWLDGTVISDAGLIKLAGLPSLGYLNVNTTHITADGVQRFQKLRPNVMLDALPIAMAPRG